MAARLETALSLARAYDGHLSVLIDTPVARFMSVDAMGGSYIAADAIREALERDDAYAAELKARLTREDVPFDIMRAEEEPVDALLECARLADLLVLSHGCDFAGEVALSAHTPVLLAAARWGEVRHCRCAAPPPAASARGRGWSRSRCRRSRGRCSLCLRPGSTRQPCPASFR